MIEIKTGDIPCCVYTSEVPNHVSFKEWFISYLESKPIFSFKDKTDSDQSIYNTDFFSNKFHQEYQDIVKPILKEHNLGLSNFLDYRDHVLQTMGVWFQQYKKGDCHHWHRHNGVFSNIYYVDLPEGTSYTSFRFRGKEFIVEAKEGQILSFPSFLEHCSKPNNSDKIKTVISFNTD